MNELEKLRAWECLKNTIAKIYDPKTRQMYYRALLARSTSEWGFNPEKPSDTHVDMDFLDLEDWQKDFIRDVNDSITFGFNVRKQKQTETLVETRRNMRYFIEHGGQLKDIPEDIRTPDIVDIYLNELFFIGEDLCDLADFAINPKD